MYIAELYWTRFNTHKQINLQFHMTKGNDDVHHGQFSLLMACHNALLIVGGWMMMMQTDGEPITF